MPRPHGGDADGPRRDAAPEDLRVRLRLMPALCVAAALVAAWLLYDAPPPPSTSTLRSEGEGDAPAAVGTGEADGPAQSAPRVGAADGTAPPQETAAAVATARPPPDEVWGRVVGPDETGVPRAQVTAYRSARDRLASRTDPVPLGATRTDAAGRFHLGPLAAGPLLLVGHADGLAPAWAWIPRAGVQAVLRLARGGDLRVQVLGEDDRGVPDLVVRYGHDRYERQERTDADGWAAFPAVPLGAATVRVVPDDQGMAIQRVTVGPDGPTEVTVRLDAGRTLAGRVLRDGDGAPVDAAAVSLVYLEQPDLAPIEARTGPDGAFAIPGVSYAAGLLEVSARKEGFATARRQWHPSPTDKPVLLSLWPAGEVHGIVVDDRDQPVEGAWAWWPSDGPLDGDGVTAVKTGAGGTFALPLPVGPGAAGWYAVAAQGPSGGHATAPIHGSALRDGEVRLVLAADGAVTGQVIDEAGAPVAGAYVLLEARPGGRPDGEAGEAWAVDQLVRSVVPAPRSALTDERGAFAFTGVPAGHYRVGAGLDERFAQAPQEIDLAAGAGPSVQILLRDVGTIRGRVVDPEGQPAGGVGVCAWPLEGHDGATSPPCVQTQADGTFTLRGALGSRAWRIVAMRSGNAPGIADGVVAGERDLEIRLLPRGGVAGQVLREGRAYAGPFRVWLVPARTVPLAAARAGLGTPWTAERLLEHAFESPEGAFAVEGTLRGDYHVQAAAADDGLLSAPVAIRADPEQRVTDLALALEPAVALAGTVRGAASGNPLAGVLIALRVLQGGQAVAAPCAVARSGDEGGYRLAPLLPGRYLLSAEGPGVRPLRETLDVGPRAAQRYDLVLEAQD